MQVAFPPDWDESIKSRIAERGRTSVADYLRDLVEADISPAYVDEETEQLLIEGLESGSSVPMDEGFYAGLRKQIDDAARKAKA